MIILSWLAVMCKTVSPQLQLMKEKEKLYRAEAMSKLHDLHTAIPALESAGRNKRFVSALPAIDGLVTLAVESISDFLERKRNKAMANALRAMEESQSQTLNRLDRYENDLLLYGKFHLNSTEEIIDTLQDMYERQTFVEQHVRNMTLDWPRR